MKKNSKNILKKPFIRNVLTLSSGTLLAQLINMLFSPLLTRIYGPEAYGVMGVFSSLISIVAPIAGLTYAIAIVLPKEEKESLGLVKLSLLIAVFNALIIAILLFFFSETLITILELESISSYIFLIPLVVILAGLLQVLENWSIRRQAFGGLAKSGINESLFTNISKLTVGFFHPYPIILVVFTALKNGIKSLYIMIYNKKKIFKARDLINVDRFTLLSVAKKYKDFPLFRAPRQFLNSATSSLPLLLLTSLFGPASAGFFSLGKTVLGVPTTLLGKSVGEVFYPRISKAANDNEKVTPLIEKATIYLSLLGILPYGIIILLGPFLFELMFGQEWTMAGAYAQWLSLWIYTDLVRMPSVNTLSVLSKQKFLLIFTILMLSIQGGSFLVGYYIFSSDVAGIALYSISGVLMNLILILFTIYFSRKFDKENNSNSYGDFNKL